MTTPPHHEPATSQSHRRGAGKEPWRAGFGRSAMAVEGLSLGRSMLGWGDPANVANGVATPLICRAMALEAQGPEGHRQRFVYLCAEICFVSEALRDAVVERLADEYGLTEAQVMVVATHNHSAPGGFSRHFWFDIPSGGFCQEVFDCYVEGYVGAARRAMAALQPAELRFTQGEAGLQHIAYNRAWRAFNHNPGVEQVDGVTAHRATGDTMQLLRADGLDGTPLGLISWFPLHGTCFHGDNLLVRPDHKGVASRMLEEDRGGDFVAIFAQESTGDITPNRRWDRRRKRMVGDAATDEEHCQEVASLQVDVARRLAADALASGLLVDGTLQSAVASFDFGAMEIDPDFADGSAGEPRHTCLPHLGSGMIIGTKEGPGPFSMMATWHRWLARLKLASWRWLKRLWPRRRQAMNAPRITLLDCPSDLDIRAGGLFSLLHPLFPAFVHPDLKRIRRAILDGTPPGDAFFPRELPVQVVRLGPILLAGIAGEPTMIAGEMLRQGLLLQCQQAVTSGQQPILYAIIGPYANSYSGYIVTPFEYLEQEYEAGSTLYGRWTLAAWQTALRQVVDRLGLDQSQPNMALDVASGGSVRG